MDTWAMCVLEGNHKPPAAVATAGGTVPDPEFEKMRLQMEVIGMQPEREERKLREPEEMALRVKELAIRDEQLER